MDSNTEGSLQQLSDLARHYYSQGWMLATGGNLSCKSSTSSDRFWVTSSGLEKNKLQPSLFLSVSTVSGQPLPGQDNLKPSAETSIHTAIYQNIPSVQAVLHVHPPESSILKFGAHLQDPVVWVELPRLEMVKGLGIWDENPMDRFLVIHNFHKVSDIADTLSKCLKENPGYRLPFFLVEGHGPTVWGQTVSEANRNLEALIYLFRVMVGRGSFARTD